MRLERSSRPFRRVLLDSPLGAIGWVYRFAPPIRAAPPKSTRGRRGRPPRRVDTQRRWRPAQRASGRSELSAGCPGAQVRCRAYSPRAQFLAISSPFCFSQDRADQSVTPHSVIPNNLIFVSLQPGYNPPRNLIAFFSATRQRPRPPNFNVHARSANFRFFFRTAGRVARTAEH